MSEVASFQRLAGGAAVLASALAVASLFVGLAGVDYDFEALSGAEAILGLGVDAADAIRWSMVLNLFGNYLLLAPVALFLWHWLRPKSPLFADLYAFSGFLFLSIGAIASGILSAVWPEAIRDYAAASAEGREIVGAVFLGFTRAIENGLQGPVQNIPATIWLMGMGSLLRKERGALGALTLVFGGFMLINSVGSVLNHGTLSMIGLSGNLLLLPLWALWLGIDLLRRPAGG